MALRMSRIYARPLVRLTLIMSAISVVLITLMFFESRMGSDAGSEPDTVATDGRAAPVEEFIVFAAADPEQGPPVGLDHEYTSEGIRRLAAALRVLVAESGGAATDELAQFDEQADRLGRDRRSHEHADIVRSVFTAAVRELVAITSMPAPELQHAANAITPEVPLLQQHGRVQRFFRMAAVVIREHRDASDRITVREVRDAADVTTSRLRRWHAWAGAADGASLSETVGARLAGDAGSGRPRRWVLSRSDTLAGSEVWHAGRAAPRRSVPDQRLGSSGPGSGFVGGVPGGLGGGGDGGSGFGRGLGG